MFRAGHAVGTVQHRAKVDRQVDLGCDVGTVRELSRSFCTESCKSRHRQGVQKSIGFAAGKHPSTTN
jgi:hypothetical protein